jgi:hypothetical protein
MTYSPYQDPRIKQALNVISSTYGDVASVEAKKKNLLKYGRSRNAGTSATTVWNQGGNETYVETNIIDTISSSSASDTVTVKIEGHTKSGSDYTFVVQTATLSGQTKAVLTTPLARMSSIVNTGAANFVGDIYGYEDTGISGGVPTDGTKIHSKVAAGEANTTQKAATTISSVDYALVTSFGADILEKTAAFADFQLQIREGGGVFRTVAKVSASNSSGASLVVFDPFLIVPPNSDIRILVVANGATTDVSASFNSILASIV